MKLFYTDEQGQKKLIAESDSIEEIIAKTDEDAKNRFVILKDLKLEKLNRNNFKVTNSQKETGYTIEE